MSNQNPKNKEEKMLVYMYKNKHGFFLILRMVPEW